MTADAYPLILSPEAQHLLFIDSPTAHAFTDKAVSNEQTPATDDLVKRGPSSVNRRIATLPALDGLADQLQTTAALLAVYISGLSNTTAETHPRNVPEAERLPG